MRRFARSALDAFAFVALPLFVCWLAAHTAALVPALLARYFGD